VHTRPANVSQETTNASVTEAWANAVRSLFYRAAAAITATGVVAVLAVPAVVTIVLLQRALHAGCAALAVQPIRLQVTFDAARFAALLRAAGDERCRANLTNHFLWDMPFPLFYAAALAALYIWVERPRQFEVNGTPTNASLERRAHFFVLAPLVAGVADLLLENLPLYMAAGRVRTVPMNAPVPEITALVWIGSLGAVAKWILVFATGIGILVELLRPPRGLVIYRARYSVLAFVVGALPLLLIPQGQDILQRLAEGTYPLTRVLTSILALLFASLAVWYCGRKVLELHFPGDLRHGAESWYAYFAEKVPRILGIALLAVAGMAFARAGVAQGWVLGATLGGLLAALVLREWRPGWLKRIGRGATFWASTWRSMELFTERMGMAILASAVALVVLFVSRQFAATERVPSYLRIAAWLCVTAAWLFYLFVSFRRPRMASQEAKAHHVTPDERQLQPPAHRAKTYETVDVGALGRGVKAGAAAAGIASVVMTGLFTYAPVTTGRFLGPLWVLALAVANAVFLGSLTVWVFARYRVPVVSLLLALSVVFSLWNDNHVVRTVGGDTRAIVEGRMPIGAHFAAWSADSAAGRAKPVAVDSVATAGGGRSVVTGAAVGGPVILVAAAGGGLRAAYWTATALAVIQDMNRGFSRQLFAISGVSGGSLGAAVFVAVARDAADTAAALSCAREAEEHPGGAPSPGPYTKCVRRFMNHDFLSPVLAKLVAPDVVQRFWPVPVHAFDRSRALEASWEQSYMQVVGDSTFSRGLAALGADTSAAMQIRVPALFLNSTHVESGRRYVAMPLRATPSMGATGNALPDAVDVLGLLGADLPLSSAVHNSARFTYISPAGRLDRGTGVEYGRVVDGGYFENSGLATLRDIYQVVRQSGHRVIVLYLCNDPLACARDMVENPSPTVRASGTNELLAPVRAVLRARDARGSLARAQVRQEVGDTNFLQLNVCESLVSPRATTRDSSAVADDPEQLPRSRERIVSPPLGWLLSRLARDWMDKSLLADVAGRGTTTSACVARNTRVLAQLRQALSPTRR
jgi:hypothetical protein